MAVIASGIVIAPAVYANSSSNIVLVPPTKLPELARQPGDAMFLRDANDGRTLLYVERNQGAKLAVFDVTDPSRVESEGSVPLGAPAPFEFVSPLGGEKELIRFRQDQGEGVLDFHKAGSPSLKQFPGINSEGPVSLLGDDGFTVSSQTVTAPKASNPPPMQDYQVIDTSGSRNPTPVFEVKQVCEEVANARTGTTFLLTENGLFLVRRPAVEWEKKRRDQEWFWQHTGG
jgi:hypothetical protein